MLRGLPILDDERSLLFGCVGVKVSSTACDAGDVVLSVSAENLLSPDPASPDGVDLTGIDVSGDIGFEIICAQAPPEETLDDADELLSSPSVVMPYDSGKEKLNYICAKKERRIKMLEEENLKLVGESMELRRMVGDVKSKDWRIGQLEAAVERVEIDRATMEKLARVAADQKIQLKRLEGEVVELSRKAALLDEKELEIKALESELLQLKLVNPHDVSAGEGIEGQRDFEDHDSQKNKEIDELREQLEDTVSTIRALQQAFWLTVGLYPLVGARAESEANPPSAVRIRQLTIRLDEA